MTSCPVPITVIILSRNRPLFLWACLDSLFSYTTYPARFILTDNQSTDPGVKDVVRGFERRGMFDTVEWHDDNDPKRVLNAVRQYRTLPGEHIVVIESDVVIFDTSPCWLTRLVALMDKYSDLGMLGSYVDTRDFIERETAERILPGRKLDEVNRLIKGKSPERNLSLDPPADDLIEPFNPPGRLIIARKSALEKMQFAKDLEIYKHAKKAGVRCAIATQVRHRHLSLLNAYDYADYDTKARDAFFQKNNSGVPIVKG